MKKKLPRKKKETPITFYFCGQSDFIALNKPKKIRGKYVLYDHPAYRLRKVLKWRIAGSKSVATPTIFLTYLTSTTVFTNTKIKSYCNK